MLTGLPAGLHRLKKKALTEAKRLVNRSSRLPDDAHIVVASDTFLRMLTWSETQSRIAKILERGFQKPGDFELRLGYGSRKIRNYDYIEVQCMAMYPVLL